MSPSHPVFLFAFANDNQATLRLGDEDNACTQALAQLDKEGKIKHRSAGFATLDRIVKELNTFNDQIYCFHFGGHSSGQGLQLADTLGKPESLAIILGQQKKLQFVFLNGCANAEQVELLWANGVKAVIATSSAVKDRWALQLADQFYQAIASGKTIRKAFDLASAYVKNNHEIDIDYVDRGLYLQQSNSLEFPWGIYVQDEAILDWSIYSIEKESRLERMQALRETSRERHQRFIGKGGRFQHLKINEAILANIEGLETKFTDLIDVNVELDAQQRTLLQALPELWQESTPHALLVGPGGMGKTVSLVRMWEQMLDAKGADAPVPVFIQLNEFNNQVEKNFIRNYIKTHFGDLDIDELLQYAHKTEAGKTKPHIVLLLDGYNEVTAQSNELLLEINQLRIPENYPGVQVVLSSRVDMRQAFQWQSFHLLELQGLSDTQISAYLQQAVPTDVRLLEVLRNPMMLSIYTAQSELPKRYQDKGYLKEQVTSVGEMLYNVEAIQRIKVEKANENDIGAIAYQRFVLEHFLPWLGWQMQQRGIFFIRRKPKNEGEISLQQLLETGCQELLHDDFFDTFEFFDQFLDETLFQSSARTLFNQVIQEVVIAKLAILSKDGDTYRFLHQNFRDYFAARHVQNQIRLALKTHTFPAVLHHPLDYYVRHLLGELEGEHYNKPIYLEAEKRWSIDHFQTDNLLHTLLESCRGVFDKEKLASTVWNILTIWVEQRGELSGADLSQIDVRNFSFSGNRLARLQLRTKFAKGLLKIKNFYPNGHSNHVIALACSPDGKYFISGSADCTAKVWNSFTGEHLLTLEGHSDAILDIDVSPDGQFIATASEDHTVKIWNHDTGKCIITLKNRPYPVRSVTYNHDGTRLVTGSKDNVVSIWNPIKAECLGTLIGHDSSVRSIVYSPDGKFIVTGSNDGNINIWDAQSEELKLVINGHLKWILTLTTNTKGTQIASGSDDKIIKLWNTTSGDCYASLIGHTDWVRSISYSPDGMRLASGSDDNTLKIWDVNSSTCLLTLQGHSDSVQSVKYSPDGKRIFSASRDKTVRIWDAQTGACLLVLEGLDNSIKNTSYSPDDSQIIICSGGQTTSIWDAKIRYCLFIINDHSDKVSSSIYMDSIFICCILSNKRTEIWDIKQGRQVSKTIDYNKLIKSKRTNFDGSKYLKDGTFDGNVKIYDAKSNKELLTLGGHLGQIKDTAFSCDGKLIVTTATFDKNIKVWDSETGQRILTLGNYSSAVLSTSFSSDGNFIITGTDDGIITIWNLRTEQSEVSIPFIPGLLLQGCDFRHLHPDSEISDEDMDVLRQYGAIFDDEDAERWEGLMEKHFGKGR